MSNQGRRVRRPYRQIIHGRRMVSVHPTSIRHHPRRPRFRHPRAIRPAGRWDPHPSSRGRDGLVDRRPMVHVELSERISQPGSRTECRG